MALGIALLTANWLSFPLSVAPFVCLSLVALLALLCGRLNALFGTLENADPFVCVFIDIRLPSSTYRLSLIQSGGAGAGSACTPDPGSRSQWPRASAPLQQQEQRRQLKMLPSRFRCVSPLTVRLSPSCLAGNFPSRLFNGQLRISAVGFEL